MLGFHMGKKRPKKKYFKDLTKGEPKGGGGDGSSKEAQEETY